MSGGWTRAHAALDLSGANGAQRIEDWRAHLAERIASIDGVAQLALREARVDRGVGRVGMPEQRLQLQSRHVALGHLRSEEVTEGMRVAMASRDLCTLAV